METVSTCAPPPTPQKPENY